MTLNLSDVIDITLNGSSVVKIEDTLGNILWEKTPEPLTETYFYVENLTGSANTLSIKKNDSSAPSVNVYRSTDKTNWTSMGSTSTTAITYSIPSNSKVYLKATANVWGRSTKYNSITCSGNYAIGGNVMSLLYGDSFIGQTVFPTSSTYNFARLFSGSTNLKNIDNLVLPATTLTNNCYGSMFSGCTGLTTLPSDLLPATTLNDECYVSMFYHCTGLTSIPSNLLPATTLAFDCYNSMFSGCTGLTTIPSNFLPATTLTDGCYGSMFYGCTSLTTVPALPATTLADYCYSYMFNDCTGITKSPELPATTLAEGCYEEMFNGCSSLNEITCYANDISATDCTSSWVDGVASSGTFYKKGSANWTTGKNGIPTGWTVDDPNKYFYVENLTGSANTLSIKKSSSSAPTITVSYSTDKTTWNSMGSTSTTEITYTIPANSKVYLRATADKWGKSSSYYNKITCSGNYAVGGNIMSLLYGDNPTGQTTFPASSTYNFSHLFYNSTYLKNISNLILPATTLTSNCYSHMFVSCTGLTSIPSNLLPATTLTEGCYYYMFAGCTEITSIPSNLLPATTLAEYCYHTMFNNCTGLTSIPTNLLPATTLQSTCYSSMFSGCTGLTSIPSNLLPATTLASNCYNSMFQGCTSITKAPELPATTLSGGCYNSMFKNCSSLNEITCYANDISASNSTASWVSGVSATGTFYKKGSASWTTGTSGIPTGWSVIDDNNEYFYVENLTNNANTLSITKNESSSPTITVYRSTDKTNWTSIGSTSTSGITYSIPANSKVYLKATTNGWCTSDTYNDNNSITCSGNYAIGGNIMSLIYGDSFIGKTAFPSSSTYNFNRLFQNSTNLKNIDNLILPATTLTGQCYQAMFYGCTGLTSIPSNLLPATTLADWCYRHMFYSCTGITSIPSNLLPATTLADYCYANMFESCTGITSIPSTLLPATTLTERCYQSMFSSTSITSIPSNLLPATTLVDSCYMSMFSRTRITSIPSTLLPATTLANQCYADMFYGCTGLTSIPSNLLQATLATWCYAGMFQDCTGITSIPANLLPATILTEYCYAYMFKGCTGIRTAPDLLADNGKNHCYYQMFYGCTSLTSARVYLSNPANTTLNPTDGMFSGISTGGTLYKPIFLDHTNEYPWSRSSTSTTATGQIPARWTIVAEIT